MTTFTLPDLPKDSIINKLFGKMHLPKSINGNGANGMLKPYLPSGEMNPRYAKRFAQQYHIKWYFDNDRLTDVPPFPLKDEHRGRKFVVLGNGPSLKKFDFSLIKNALTIGINVTSEFYHAAYVFVSSPFALIRLQPFLDPEKSTLLIQAGLWNARTYKDIWARFPGRVIPVYTGGSCDWDISGGRIIGSGPVAGLMAIDMAILMGAASLLVVGCDGYRGRKLNEMYAGNYAETYRRALASRQSIASYEQMLWQREEDVHNKYCQRQQYCREKGIGFAVWGEDNNYTNLHRIENGELPQWC